MRALFAGEAVTHDGLVRSSQARLYVRPDVPPPLYAAALTPETATWAAEWADGLITAPGSPEQAREIIDAFRRAGGAAKPVLAQVVVAYAASDTEALAAAHDQWRQVALDGEALASLPTPQVVDAATADVSPQQVAEKLLATADLGRHVELLQQYAALGIDTVYVHNVTRDQRAFIAAYGRDVIPALAV
jgi:coenzyme F420-dependent glucose-6-phosphate dehydrogenase